MYHVLVVDDDPVLQSSIKEALEFHDFNVSVASNGNEAVRAVYRQNFDLVVMDVNMPEMNGIEALVEIKKHNLATIVLILTAYSNVQDAVRAVKEGAYNYLEKPISSENLVALIKRALKARSMVETMALSAPTMTTPHFCPTPVEKVTEKSVNEKKDEKSTTDLSLGQKSTSDKFVGESTA
ncbi:MAG: sigma-54-dependent Fis family transcriptional regulator, partial [Oligoflexia bacterium]|nr:sigma-54-dependent Fis family transcriptional regulator [Oligoflexia bacterium]